MLSNLQRFTLQTSSLRVRLVGPRPFSTELTDPPPYVHPLTQVVLNRLQNSHATFLESSGLAKNIEFRKVRRAEGYRV